MRKLVMAGTPMIVANDDTRLGLAIMLVTIRIVHIEHNAVASVVELKIDQFHCLLV